MNFYEKFVYLCEKRGLKPQSEEIIAMTGVSSPAISNWKKGAFPKAEVLIKIAEYFNVSVDYLLDLDTPTTDNSVNISNSINESPNSTLTINQNLSKQETELVEIFRQFDLEAQSKLITYALKLRLGR